MRVAGIAVDVPSRGRPAAHIVVIDNGGGVPLVDQVADFSTDDTDLAMQLHDLAEAVRSRLTGLHLDRVVLRRADRPPRASNVEGPRLRLLAEGAVTSASRSVVVDTRIGTGKDTGAWFGSTKASLDAAAVQLLSDHGLPVRYREAASAGLAALAAA